jgi:hypothetical protein
MAGPWPCLFENCTFQHYLIPLCTKPSRSSHYCRELGWLSSRSRLSIMSIRVQECTSRNVSKLAKSIFTNITAPSLPYFLAKILMATRPTIPESIPFELQHGKDPIPPEDPKAPFSVEDQHRKKIYEAYQKVKLNGFTVSEINRLGMLGQALCKARQSRQPLPRFLSTSQLGERK